MPRCPNVRVLQGRLGHGVATAQSGNTVVMTTESAAWTPGHQISTARPAAKLRRPDAALDTDMDASVQMPTQVNVSKRHQTKVTASPRPRPSAKENAVSASTLLDRATPVATDLPSEVHPDQLTLPLTWEVADGVPSVPALPRHLRVVGSESTDAQSTPAPRPTAAWVARMARAVIEVADGDRPSSQLTRWVERAPLAMLHARGMAFRRHPAVRGRRGSLAATRATQQVRAVRICPVTPRAVEASAVLVGGGRGRAVALRFEARETEWIVTAVALG